MEFTLDAEKVDQKVEVDVSTTRRAVSTPSHGEFHVEASGSSAWKTPVPTRSKNCRVLVSGLLDEESCDTISTNRDGS